jgi:hypothetical protein
MKTSVFIGIIILLTLGGLILLNGITPPIPQRGIETLQSQPREKVSLIINYGDGTSDIFERKFREGMTAFDLLTEETQGSALTLKTKTYDMGVFIEAIGNKENGQEGKYWLYYLNGEMPMVSADKKEIKPGDKIEFKFEESPF